MHTIFEHDRIRRFPMRSGAAVLGLLLALPLFAAQIIAYWLELARQRRHLARLDDRMLKDIGLSRADVEQEIAKPFWRYH
jgi:uncharacterized protein YjiS (DUF1127 family)